MSKVLNIAARRTEGPCPLPEIKAESLRVHTTLCPKDSQSKCAQVASDFVSLLATPSPRGCRGPEESSSRSLVTLLLYELSGEGTWNRRSQRWKRPSLSGTELTSQQVVLKFAPFSKEQKPCGHFLRSLSKLYGKLRCQEETPSGNAQKRAESWVPLEPI